MHVRSISTEDMHTVQFFSVSTMQDFFVIYVILNIYLWSEKMEKRGQSPSPAMHRSYGEWVGGYGGVGFLTTFFPPWSFLQHIGSQFS